MSSCRPGADGVASHPGVVLGAGADGVLALEIRTAGGVLGVTSLRGFRVDRRVQRVEPAFTVAVRLVRSIANRGDDEDVAGAGGGDVGEADAFGGFAGDLFGLVVEQVAGAQPMSGIAQRPRAASMWRLASCD